MLLLTNHDPATDPAVKAIQTCLNRLGIPFTTEVSDSQKQTKAIIMRAVTSAAHQTVAIYGGDGTVAPAMKAAAGTSLQLLILPGGTDNSLARATATPYNHARALERFAEGGFLIRYLPVGVADGQPFMVDAHFGWSERSLTTTPPHWKRLFGRLAYTMNAVRAKADLTASRYDIEVDGQRKVISGYTCIVANHGNPLLPGLPLFRRKQPGRLYIAILRRSDTVSLIRWYVLRRFFGRLSPAIVYAAYGKKIVLHSGPSNYIIDEHPRRTAYPFTAEFGSSYVKVVVPQQPPMRLIAIWHWLQTSYYRNTDQLRRIITGMPSERFSLIGPGLYLGGQYGPQALNEFKRRGITGIVSMRTFVPKPLEASHGIRIMHLPTTDRAAPRLEDLRRGADFIQQQLQQGGSVYVHCRQGEGRGPTMAAAYLISQGMRPQDAIAHLRSFRPFANPTKPQVRQLNEFWQQLQSTHSKK